MLEDVAAAVVEAEDSRAVVQVEGVVREEDSAVDVVERRYITLRYGGRIRVGRAKFVLCIHHSLAFSGVYGIVAAWVCSYDAGFQFKKSLKIKVRWCI